MREAHNGSPRERSGPLKGWAWAPALLAAVLLALFTWGAVELVTLPLKTGEVYPQFSSLRADPQGAMALYESLQALPELSVSRMFKQPSPLNAGNALLALGTSAGSWTEIPQNAVTAYEKLVAKGGRLVIAFLPVRMPSKAPSSSPVLKDRWKIELAYRKPNREPPQRSDVLPRRSALYFVPGAEWKILEIDDNAPVAVERAVGGGSIELIADSFPLSNEGLRESRNTEMIAGMIGGARGVAFDENHFGVSDTGSVGVLLRKYGLEGGVAALLASAALFIWRSASSFLPLRQQAREVAVAGRNVQEGLTALLRRSVPEAELLDACYAEWSRTNPAARKAAAVESAIAAGRGRGVAEIYRAASQALNQKKL